MEPLDLEQIISALRAGELRTAARLISRIENNDPELLPLLKKLYLLGGNTQVVGITGPPGAGKSTLVNQLVSSYRQNDKRVAVLAVDPSSPFSGGAILGDRVRMSRHDADPGVFIRSMASRGSLGGLANAAADTISLLDIMGWDLIIVETVGVGQNELEIMRHADTVVLIQTPESGDAVQAVKAGVLEIGDIFAVNKADHHDADKLAAAIADMVASKGLVEGWIPEVIKTEAVSGKGIDELMTHIGAHQNFLKDSTPAVRARNLQKVRFRVLDICKQNATRKLLEGQYASDIEPKLSAVVDRESDPYTVAAELID